MATQNISKPVKKKKQIIEPGIYQSETPDFSQYRSIPAPNPLNAGTYENKLKGEYDSKRGGYVTSEGKFYPTGNPDFRPGETDSNITFNKDKTVTVQKGEVSQTLTPEEYKTLQGQSGALTDKVKEIGLAPNLRERKIQQLIQMAQEGLLTQEELSLIGGADLNVGQALGAGIAGAAPGLIGGATTGVLAGIAGGAATGAAAGGFVTPAAIALGAAGAVTGFLVAVRSNIKSQQAGEFAADQTALTKGERYLRSLITDTNQNPQNAPENIALFYQTLNLIDAAHAKTWKDSQENLNKHLGNDGTQQLAKFEVFDQTMRNYYISQFNTALQTPNPNQILITSEDLNEVE